MDNKTRRLKRLDKILINLYSQVEQNSELCDVTLECDGQEIKCHWCVLVSCPFFEALYHSNLQEKKNGRISMEFKDASRLSDAIGFLYGRKVHLNDNNVASILEISDFLFIDKLRDMCVAYIKQIKVNTSNCLNLYKLYYLYDIENRYTLDDLDNFVKGNLLTILRKEEAIHFNQQFTRSLVTDQDLSYIPREDILLFLVAWANCKPIERKEAFLEIVNLLDTSVIEEEVFEERIQSLDFSVPNLTKKHDSRQMPRPTIVIYSSNFMYGDSSDGTVYKLPGRIPYEIRRAQISSSGSTLYQFKSSTKTTGKKYQKKSFFYFTQSDFELLSYNLDTPSCVCSRNVRIEENGMILSTRNLKFVEHSNARFAVCRTSEKKNLLCQESEISDQSVTYKSVFLYTAEPKSAILVSGKYVCSAISQELHVYCTKTGQSATTYVKNEFDTKFMYATGSRIVIMKSVSDIHHTGEYLEIDIVTNGHGSLTLNRKTLHLPDIEAEEAVRNSTFRIICGQWYCACEMNMDNSSIWSNAVDVNLYRLEIDGSGLGARWQQLNVPREDSIAIRDGQYFETLLSVKNACTQNCPHCAQVYNRLRADIVPVSEYREFSSDEERRTRRNENVSNTNQLLTSLRLLDLMSSANEYDYDYDSDPYDPYGNYW